jgi:hypothetical protein
MALNEASVVITPETTAGATFFTTPVDSDDETGSLLHLWVFASLCSLLRRNKLLVKTSLTAA